MKMNLVIAASLSLIVISVSGGLYKWVDDDGNVQYSDKPPPNQQVQEIKVDKAPIPSTEESVLERIKRHQESQQDYSHPTRASVPLKALGPLPKNTKSEYLATTSTSFVVNYKKSTAKYALAINATHRLPYGAYLEASFENPDDAQSPIVIGKTYRDSSKSFSFSTPAFHNLVCGNYKVEINVFRNESKQRKLGTHTQTVQSRWNLQKIKSATNPRDALKKALTTGYCP